MPRNIFLVDRSRRLCPMTMSQVGANAEIGPRLLFTEISMPLAFDLSSIHRVIVGR